MVGNILHLICVFIHSFNECDRKVAVEFHCVTQFQVAANVYTIYYSLDKIQKVTVLLSLNVTSETGRKFSSPHLQLPWTTIEEVGSKPNAAPIL